MLGCIKSQYIYIHIFRYLCLSSVCYFELHTLGLSLESQRIPFLKHRFQRFITVAQLDDYMLCSRPQQQIQFLVDKYLPAYLQCLNRFPDTEIPSSAINLFGTPKQQEGANNLNDDP